MLLVEMQKSEFLQVITPRFDARQLIETELCSAYRLKRKVIEYTDHHSINSIKIE